MTNRQRREWRKERFFKRRTMRYIRTTIKSFPEQDFSPNIEKYHLLDVIFLAISIIVLAVVSITYYFIREINWVIVVTYQIFEALTVATGIFIVHIEQRAIKKDDLLVFFAANVP